MKSAIKVPTVGESISEATIAQWLKKSGEHVKRDDVLLSLETDKASVEVVSEFEGILTTLAKEGDVVKIGAVVAEVDSAGVATAPSNAAPSKATTPTPPAGASASSSPAMKPPQSVNAGVLSPAVRTLVGETGINPQSLAGSGLGGRVTKGDVLHALNSAPGISGSAPTAAKETKSEIPPLPQAKGLSIGEEIERRPMTSLRRTIAARLVEAQHTAAILTTFNEIDMSNVMEVRTKYKETFQKKYGINLGFMGFFVKATLEALKTFPLVNGSIEGSDLLIKKFYHIGIAVSSEKGLIVPVIRHADHLSIAEIELAIKHYATKARDGKISIDDLSGGTFTISNGGVFGSMMSTPILNPPQSGILGLHKIEERPVAIQGKVEVRPMMYVALSYDHRMIDGRESVSFLVRIKECMEDPTRMLLEV